MKRLVPITAVIAQMALFAHAQTSRPAQTESADQILATYDGAIAPTLDRARISDKQYVKTYIQAWAEVDAQKTQAAKALLDAFPDHPRLPEIARQRWNSLNRKDGSETIFVETKSIIERNTNPPLVQAAKSFVAQLALNLAAQGKFPRNNALAAATELLSTYPDDPSAAEVRYLIAELEEDPAAFVAGLTAVTTKHAGTPQAQMAQSRLVQAALVGKPLELKFNDAVTGREVTMQSLRGKVVVLDFWATWCDPCVREIPNVKRLYEKYKNAGVEFVGISLDAPENEGGLANLKKFVADQALAWPQYYQGGPEGFSSTVGVHAIPCVFVVDQSGKLYSIQGRQNLEIIISKLLASPAGDK